MSIRDAIAEQGRRFIEGMTGGVVRPQEMIPVEEMDLRTIARVILKPPLNAEDDERPLEDFTTTDLLNQMGHWALMDVEDYSEVFPEEYRKARALIDELVRYAVLERQEMEEPDIKHERFKHNIKDRAALEAISTGRDQGLK